MIVVVKGEEGDVSVVSVIGSKIGSEKGGVDEPDKLVCLSGSSGELDCGWR